MNEWLKNLEVGSPVIVYSEPKPGSKFMHLAEIRKVDEEFYWVEYSAALCAFDRIDGIFTYVKGGKRHKQETLKLEEATKKTIKDIKLTKEKRALLQRIYRMTEPTYRASYDRGFKTPLLIPKETIDKISKKLKIEDIHEINELVENTLKAETGKFQSDHNRLLTLKELRFIWDKIKETEQNYLNTGFKFRGKEDEYLE